MKKITLACLAFFLISSSFAQYKTAIGAFVGYPNGLSAKQEISTNNDFANLSICQRKSAGNTGQGKPIIITLLYDKNIENKSSSRAVSNTYYVFGGGAHTSFYKNDAGSKMGIGIDVHAAVEFEFSNMPLLLGIEIKPYYDFVGAEQAPTYVEAGLTLRYYLD